jgi:hypothetical protein
MKVSMNANGPFQLQQEPIGLQNGCPSSARQEAAFLLAAKGSTEARRLFFDGEGQICADPHGLPRDQALLIVH